MNYEKKFVPSKNIRNDCQILSSIKPSVEWLFKIPIRTTKILKNNVQLRLTNNKKIE